jgi:hypothetical protein
MHVQMYRARPDVWIQSIRLEQNTHRGILPKRHIWLSRLDLSG